LFPIHSLAEGGLDSGYLFLVYKEGAGKNAKVIFNDRDLSDHWTLQSSIANNRGRVWFYSFVVILIFLGGDG
jgi:hypothetical protein